MYPLGGLLLNVQMNMVRRFNESNNLKLMNEFVSKLIFYFNFQCFYNYIFKNNILHFWLFTITSAMISLTQDKTSVEKITSASNKVRGRKIAWPNPPTSLKDLKRDQSRQNICVLGLLLPSSCSFKFARTTK